MDIVPGTEVPLKVRTLILKDEAIGEKRLFRLYNLEDPIFIHRELKDAIVANGFTGFRFDEVGTFTKGIW
jgi:hypothetical protein